MRALILVILLLTGTHPLETVKAQAAIDFGYEDQALQGSGSFIPGRKVLHQALLLMQRTELTPSQRLALAEPLFQQAIGASEEIDVGNINRELRSLARQATDCTPKERKKLGPRAAELLETLKQPLQARLIFASILQNTAAETRDRAMNQRAINLLQSIEVKDPGAKMDAAVQGCLASCRKQPISPISEQEALALGQTEVERNRAEKLRQSGELDWQKIFGTVCDLLLGMVFCCGVSSLGKIVVQRLRRQRSALAVGRGPDIAQGPP